MSGIAGILLGMGYRVSGSDIAASPVTERLTRLGAHVSIGHSAEALPADASLLVYSSAVEEDNPEIVAARERGLPVVRRAEVLAELMRMKFGVGIAGSHGKTTTTSMTGEILEKAGLDPTVIIGGIVKSFGAGDRLGQGQFLVAESDESDRSFLLLNPTVAVVTNIDAEHMNAYSSLRDLEDSFERFLQAVPFYGLAIVCIDDKKLRALAKRFTGRVMTYGFSLDADVRAENLEFKKGVSSYDLLIKGEFVQRIRLALPGKHLVQNSLAAIAVAIEFGVPLTVIADALSQFGGVGRRLEVLSTVNDITVIDDYGHHPTEIIASIRAVRDAWLSEGHGRLFVLFQPHRYTRTRDCFAEFLDAFESVDTLIVGDIYTAGEEEIEGISAAKLCKAMRHEAVHYVGDLLDSIDGLVRKVEAGDVVLCLGAGSMGKIAHAVAEAFSSQSAA